MLVLALDTTTRRGSVALVRGGVVLESFSGDATVTHGQRLPGDLMRVLDRQQLAVRDIDLFAVAAGPGSFTGLRIGIATMQGLALATDKGVVGVSALDALYAAVRSDMSAASSALPVEVGIWMDAQRGEVFSALYAGNGALLDGPSVGKPTETLDRWRVSSQTRPIVLAGEGAVAYAGLIHEAIPDGRLLSEVPMLAPSIARLAEAAAREGAPLLPDIIRPIYVRRSDAELARDRRQGRKPMTWIIERTLSEGDLDEIVSLEKASFSNPWTRQMYLRELQNPDVSFLYVLRVADQIAGFCAFWLVLDEIHINNLAVQRDRQGQGLGTALLRHVLQAGANRGAQRATLEVRRSNAPALRLYQRLGFEVAATRPNYYVSPSEDALILWKGALDASRSNA